MINQIGAEVVAEGLRWRVIGHKPNDKGQLVEELSLLGPASAASPKNKKVKNPRKIKINDTTSLNISRSGVSLSIQLAPGLSIITGAGRGSRLNVNMGSLRFSRSLKKNGKRITTHKTT